MLVSIIMPYFRKKKYVKQSIMSVLSQSYQNFELILIYDDYNSDELAFINQLIKLDNRIKLIVNKKNLGAGYSRNEGIKLSKGLYIAFLDGDDIWNKEKLSKQLDFMKKNNLSITHTSYEIINEDGKKIGERIAKDMNFEKLIKSCDIGLSSVVALKKIFNDKLKFPNLKTKEDFVLWLKITKNGLNINAIDEQLLEWRKSDSSLSSSTFRKLIDGYYVYKKYLNYGILKSIYCLFILSVNFLRKK